MKDERLLRALAGPNIKVFEELKLALALALSEAPIYRRSQTPQQREGGAGRKFRLLGTVK